MAQKTSIEWTRGDDGSPGYTSNPLYAERLSDGKRGWVCGRVSPGCEHCYSEALNRRWGTGLDYTKQNERLVRVVLNRKELASWSKLPPGSRCFPFDMTDLFHDLVTDEMLDEVFGAFAVNPHVTFQVLTKRADRMRRYLTGGYADRVGSALKRIANEAHDAAAEVAAVNLWHQMKFGGLPNLWAGVSVEDQRRAEERIPHLVECPVAVRFLSVEPLLAPVDLTEIELVRPEPPHGPGAWLDALRGHVIGPDDILDARVDWVICGGESGGGARPMDLAWARSVVAQCRAAKVPVFVKQLGARPEYRCGACSGKPAEQCRMYPAAQGVGHGSDGLVRLHLRDAKGGDPDEWPEDLRVREMPAMVAATPGGTT